MTTFNLNYLFKKYLVFRYSLILKHGGLGCPHRNLGEGAQFCP